MILLVKGEPLGGKGVTTPKGRRRPELATMCDFGHMQLKSHAIAPCVETSHAIKITLIKQV